MIVRHTYPLVAALALGLFVAAPERSEAQVYNWQSINPYTGQYYQQSWGYDPWVRQYGRSYATTNPFTGSYARYGTGYNPYAGAYLQNQNVLQPVHWLEHTRSADLPAMEHTYQTYRYYLPGPR